MLPAETFYCTKGLWMTGLLMCVSLVYLVDFRCCKQKHLENWESPVVAWEYLNYWNSNLTTLQHAYAWANYPLNIFFFLLSHQSINIIIQQSHLIYKSHFDLYHHQTNHKWCNQGALSITSNRGARTDFCSGRKLWFSIQIIYLLRILCIFQHSWCQE